jgi:hypothetical protein
LLGLAKTCDKLGVAFWDYLGSRFKVAGHILVESIQNPGGLESWVRFWAHGER